MFHYKEIRIDYMDRKHKVVTSITIESENDESAFDRLYEIREMLDKEELTYIVFVKKRKFFSKWERFYTINDLKVAKED